jgi:hypothetical protein
MNVFGEHPYTHAEVVTKHDSNAQGNLANRSSDAVYVGGAGDIAVVMSNGTVVLSAVPAGTLLPIRISRLNSTNTTATLVAALWY